MSGSIVVGVSGTSSSLRAADWAVARAAERGRRVELVSVVGGAVGVVGESDVIGEARDALQRMLEDRRDSLAHLGVEIDVRVVGGRVVDELAAAAEGATELVIGAAEHGSSSTGIRISGAAPCPVITVPDASLDGRSGVVVGVDGSDLSMDAIRFAATEAERLHEPLTAVCVWTPVELQRSAVTYPDLYLVNMQAITEETLGLSLAGLRQDHPDLELIEHVERGFPSAVLSALSATARMVVVGSHGRGAIRRFLLGSVSHELLSRASSAVAVVR